MAENKKDSFTFSDKIKNSKPAFNPFSKRVSSKIGNNGKPKKTLFERTRRDAPFFVAAAAALLMLPFLYKYSGSVEDGEIITPGTDSVFEPDHTRIDPILEDPSAQIAQLSVRDPLSLIKGWGDPEPAPSVGSYDRDGMDDTYTPPARSYRNESPYRQQAPAASRAAFQRQAPAPTKVGKLGSASMNLRGGGGGFGRFGGANLKTAAKASSAAAPQAGVKPVSLQPLRAAGNPSRSYFGQGAAAQARASRDAMGKSNALQALTDAMYDPLKANQAPLGGLGGGDFVGGAGAGKWDPHSEYKGITPWWWDMMKQQEMEKWKWKYFLWKKGLVEPLIKGLADFLVKFGTGVMSCLFTATDDISMGSMGPKGATDKVDANCKCNEGTVYSAQDLHTQILGNTTTLPKEPDFEKMCLSKDATEKHGCEWNKGAPASPAMSYWDRVKTCFNENHVPKPKGAREVEEVYNCEKVGTHTFVLNPLGYYAKPKYDKFYHIVIAKNKQINGKWLCEAEKIDAGWSMAAVNSGGGEKGNNGVSHGAASTTGSGQVIFHTSKDNSSSDHYVVAGGARASYNTRDANGILAINENENAVQYAEDCVIYVAEGKSFNYDNYKLLLQEAEKAGTVDETENSMNMHQAGKTKGSVRAGEKPQNFKGVDWDEQTIEYFAGNIVPVAIEGYVMTKNPFENKRKMRKKFPMAYKDFLTHYMDGEDAGMRLCEWDNFDIVAKHIPAMTEVQASLIFDEDQIKDPNNMVVSLKVVGPNGEPLAQIDKVEPTADSNYKHYRANFTHEQLKEMSKVTAENEVLYANWTATYQPADGEKLVAEDSESYLGKITVIQATQQPLENPAVGTKEVRQDVALLSTSITGIPATWNQRNKVVTSGAPGKVNSAAALITSLGEEADEEKFSTMFVGSEAATEYVNRIVEAYNTKISDATPEGQDKVLLGKIQHKYPLVPEFVDAMNIASTGLNESTIAKNIVCDMARGIASKSVDNTPNDTNQRKSTHRGDSMDNTFGTFAIYIGDGHLYPNKMVSVRGAAPIVDLRFDCIEKGKYICTPDYSWENYVNANTKKASSTAARIIGQKAAIDQIKYPLEALKQTVTGSTAEDLRENYHKAYANIFAGEDQCQIDGEMYLEDALNYVKLVAKNGTSFKPHASDRRAGDVVGQTNVTYETEGSATIAQNSGTRSR